MAHVFDRREMLKACAAAGAAFPHVLQAAASGPARDSASIQNQFLRVEYEAATGRLHAWLGDGQPFVVNAVARAMAGGGARSSADAEYTRKVEVRGIRDGLGSGRQLVARCTDGKRQLDLELRATLYDDRKALVVELICQNVSDVEMVVSAVEPVRMVPEDGGGLRWPGASKILTNGKMYYDAGRVLDFDIGKKAESWWNVGLYRGDRAPGLAIGYLENSTAMGRILSSHGYVEIPPAGEPGEAVSIVAESQYEKGFVLKPGASVSSDRVILNLADDPFTALETYADAIRAAHHVRLNPVANGWCSWFSFFGFISEAEVIRQAEFAAKYLKPYGLDVIQVDDGFYRAFGDWERNARFPHGMKWLAGRIRELGLRPGIWFAPYVIQEGTPIHREHPDWLIHNLDGKLKQIGPGLIEGSEEAAKQNPKWYALDITHPGAAAWFRDLFKTAAHDWGYEFIKIDFVDWTTLAAERFHDPTMSVAAVYRKGFEIMREAVGPDRHLLDCGPGQVTVGLLDSMRIELDQPPVRWKQYYSEPASSGPAAAKRYYFHKRTWINDDDHVVLEGLTIPQAQAAASVVVLSGGTMMSGDRMSDLDAVRLDILRKVLPSYGEAARPVDLFERDRPEIFALPIRKPFGEWLVLGVFNADESAPSEKTIPIERLRLDPAKTYLAYDFWKQRLHGELREKVELKLEPSSCTVLAIHEKRAIPQVIGSDRHVLQGAIELADLTWDAAASTIRGVSIGPKGSDHRLAIHLPEPHPWVQADPFLFCDHEAYTLRMMDPNTLRVHVRFEKGERVRWEVNLTQFWK